jgi:hypothetical protein
MKLARVAKLLKVQRQNIFPVPSVNSLIRVGKIPKTKEMHEFWTPAWKMTPKYDDKQAATILAMLKRRIREFAIAFENEDNFLILSDQALDNDYAEEILAEMTSKG